MFSNLYVNAAFQGPDNNQDVEAAIANGYRDAAFQGSDNVITGPKAFGFGYRDDAFQGSDNEPARSCAGPTGVQG